ncbi:MAG: hypothetical protein E7213_01090 [Clostridium sp.]|nr:hypothetical protein [Clostridium sp.]
MIIAGFLSAIVFEIISISFLIFRKRESLFIGRFNLFLKSKNREFDIYKFKIDMCNTFFVAGLIIIIGVILSEMISEKILIVAFIISLLFIIIKNWNIASAKFFEKYTK